MEISSMQLAYGLQVANNLEGAIGHENLGISVERKETQELSPVHLNIY
jgi:hypothetical protein